MRLRTGQSGFASNRLSGSIRTVTVASAGVGAEEVSLTTAGSSGTESVWVGLRAASFRVAGSVRVAAST